MRTIATVKHITVENVGVSGCSDSILIQDWAIKKSAMELLTKHHTLVGTFPLTFVNIRPICV
uniref:Uncharacterized protein n=1 Tax=Anguilla anguilla TaxID=7936 RepID=A0A0E9TRS6_ANGAN